MRSVFQFLFALRALHLSNVAKRSFSNEQCVLGFRHFAALIRRGGVGFFLVFASVHIVGELIIVVAIHRDSRRYELQHSHPVMLRGESVMNAERLGGFSATVQGRVRVCVCVCVSACVHVCVCVCP